MKGFLDIETGGFSITKNGVCEIALLAVDDSFKIVDTFHKYIKPYTREESDELVYYHPDAMNINGLSPEYLNKVGEDVGYVMIQLSYFIIKHNITEIIGHNSNQFDVPRIDYLFRRFYPNQFTEIGLKDTLLIAKERLDLPSYKLEHLCLHFGIRNEQAHSAVSDALATLELYKKLIA